MKVKELAEWLAKFPDQDATVEVIEHTAGRGHDQQGGIACRAVFDPEKHSDYTDLRCNQFAPQDSRWLLIGVING